MYLSIFVKSSFGRSTNLRVRFRAITGLSIIFLLVTTSATVIIASFPISTAQRRHPPELVADTPIATSGDNVYTAWPSNDTGRWNVFFAKSIDNGNTFNKTMVISSPNPGNVTHENVNIAATGSSVYVSWWNNKTGVFEPVFRASTDNGDTFGKIIKLNSTAGGISK
jgi:hypothetical protein